MDDVMISVENIDKSFGGVHALKQVSMTVRKGEIHCLAGENGSGKSTLIKVISGYYKPDSGVIRIGDHAYASLTPAESIRDGVQVIYQDFSLFPNLSVMENLALNSEVARGTKIVSYRRMRETARQAVEKIGLKVDMNARVADLSVADRQMIAIARALVHKAKVVIMDEATSSLTRKEVNRLFEVIHAMRDEGVAVVFVSHKLDEVFEISDTITIFRNGRNVISCAASEMDESKFSYYMTGREMKTVDNEPPVGDESQVVLDVKNLSSQGAFENVNFQLRRGEILGVAGQLGSGRTELAMALFGLQPITGGAVSIHGKPVRIKNVMEAQRLGIAYVPEDRLTEGLFMPQSLTRNEIITHLKAVSKKGGVLDKSKADAEMDSWIQTLSVATDSRDTAAQKLSGGNQQKVVLAKWLACKPDILILNGPTVGVDIGAKQDIYDLLCHYAREGMSIIIASDDIREVEALCNRVIVMRGGKVSRFLTGDEITAASLTEAAI